jgi:hypothetical protein
MERPDPVNRVAPPITTMAKTSKAVANSQAATVVDRSRL